MTINIQDELVPQGTFKIVDNENIKGGFKVVDNDYELSNLTDISDGMFSFVKNSNKVKKYDGTSWTDMFTVSNFGGFENINAESMAVTGNITSGANVGVGGDVNVSGDVTASTGTVTGDVIYSNSGVFAAGGLHAATIVEVGGTLFEEKMAKLVNYKMSSGKSKVIYGLEVELTANATYGPGFTVHPGLAITPAGDLVHLLNDVVVNTQLQDIEGGTFSGLPKGDQVFFFVKDGGSVFPHYDIDADKKPVINSGTEDPNDYAYIGSALLVDGNNTGDTVSKAWYSQIKNLGGNRRRVAFPKHADNLLTSGNLSPTPKRFDVEADSFTYTGTVIGTISNSSGDVQDVNPCITIQGSVYPIDYLTIADGSSESFLRKAFFVTSGSGSTFLSLSMLETITNVDHVSQSWTIQTSYYEETIP